MSSHHIVRESQEPAFLILQPDHISCDHIGPLLEWSPSIVVMETALQKVAASGIKVDVVVFAHEHLEDVNEQLRSQAPVSFIPVQKPQDFLLKALHFLAEKEQQAVNILLQAAGNEPELLAFLAGQNIIKNVVLLDDKEKWALCRSGSYSKWYPSGEEIKVIPLANGPQPDISGSTEEIPDAEERRVKKISTTQAGTIKIHSGEAFWIAEQLF